MGWRKKVSSVRRLTVERVERSCCWGAKVAAIWISGMALLR
jgi:hypothetical protein